MSVQRDARITADTRQKEADDVISPNYLLCWLCYFEFFLIAVMPTYLKYQVTLQFRDDLMRLKNSFDS